ncbi:hypothetical protein ACJX0J_037855 [Zea mays]
MGNINFPSPGQGPTTMWAPIQTGNTSSQSTMIPASQSALYWNHYMNFSLYRFELNTNPVARPINLVSKWTLIELLRDVPNTQHAMVVMHVFFWAHEFNNITGHFNQNL